MKKIGILHGKERSFPEAFCAAVNARDEGAIAEPCRLEGARHDMGRQYDVIVDRISHEVPFYSLYLKHAALLGTVVINNPYWRLADDKYLGTCIVDRLGIAVPKTLILPQREYVDDISPESLTNLGLVNWEGICAWAGLPLYIKPATGGGWKSVARCETQEDLLRSYNESGDLVMMVQENIEWEAYSRLLVIGRTDVWVAPWDPTLPHHQRYSHAGFEFSDALKSTMIEQALSLNQTLGYDMNTVEFAIKDGVPYAIDFTNTAPDFDRASLTEEAFEWVVEKMADLALARTADGAAEEVPLRWQELL
jgi:hypothetical protein